MAKRRDLRRSLTGVAFVAPAACFMLLFMLVPLVLAMKDAFYENTISTITSHFVGLGNFRAFFRTASLRSSVPTTIIFVIASTLGAFALGLTWALVLENLHRSRVLLRSLTLIPWILPSVVSAFLWAWIFNAQFGLLNGFGRELTLLHSNVAWLANPTTAQAAVILARIWQSMPWFVLMFVAGLQTVPGELCDAMRTDGGSNWQLFRHVIVPHIRFPMLLAIMLGAMGNLQLFDLVYAMTGGGPGSATATMSLAVYQQAFQVFNEGVASAIGIVWIITLAVPAAIYVKFVMPSRPKGEVNV